MSAGTRWWNQFRALAMKNTVTLLRKPVLLLIALLLPFFAFISVSAIKFSINRDNTDALRAELWKKPTSLGEIPEGAYVFYYPTSEVADSIMLRLSSLSNIPFGQRVIGYPTDLDLATDLIKRARELVSLRSIAVIHWTSSLEENTTVTYTIRDTRDLYSVYDNFDTKSPRLNVKQMAYKVALDAAILSYARDPTASADYSKDRFAANINFYRATGTPSDTFNGTQPYVMRQSEPTPVVDIGNIILKPILAVSFLPIMVLALELVSKEKHKKLLGALRRMGLMDSAFWLAAAVSLLPLCIATSLLGAAGARIGAYSGGLFSLVSFEVVAITNFCYSVSILGLGLMWSAAIARPFLVNIIVGLSGAATVIINFVFFIPQSATLPFVAVWFNDCRQSYAKILLLVFAPFYNFAKCWNDIILITSPSMLNNNTINPFGMEQFIFTSRRIFPNDTTLKELSVSDMNALNIYRSEADTTSLTCIQMLGSIGIFLILAWYVNQVFPSPEGFRRPLFFFFTRSYWTGRERRKQAIVEGDTLALEKDLSRKTDSVRIVKLSKQYAGNTAVKEFSSVFEKGKVYALLGHNGDEEKTVIMSDEPFNGSILSPAEEYGASFKK
ncbi:hypothetical protein HDU67_002108 [Dinochytrium kinnereticum]|nr:hypothetical protein HDU67_002108 [Dinochytrium kinnereticum]